MSETNHDMRPVPDADDISRFFWDGARHERLLLQRCERCSRYQYPPDVACVYCQSCELKPTELNGRGTLYSYAVVERAFHAGFVDSVPYVIGLVELEEQPGLRMLTNIVDTALDRLAIGMPVEVVFERRGEIALPQFRLLEQATPVPTAAG